MNTLVYFSVVTIFIYALEYRTLNTNEIETFSNRCPHIQPRSNCPKGFQFFPSQIKGLCYFINKNQSFPPTCDLPNSLPFSNVNNYLRTISTDVGFWINALKNDSSGFPHLEWIEPGDKYGTRFDHRVLGNPNESEKKCVIFKDGVIRLASCAMKFDTPCFYSLFTFEYWEMNKLCNNGSYDGCIFSDYDLSRPTCFCVKTGEALPLNGGRCEKLAEPQYPFQSQLLNKYFESTSNVCWIGLQKIMHDYKWMSSGKSIDYSIWAQPKSCNARDGAFVFAKDPYGGWLTTENRLTCALCEIKITAKKSSITLNYNEDINQIQLLLENPDFLRQSYVYKLSCFRDSNLEDFKERITFIYATMLESSATAVYANLTNYPSNYWCYAFGYSSDLPVFSNRIIAFDKHLGYGNEFTLLIEAKEESGIDPFFNNIHAWITSKISEVMRTCYKALDNIRPMRGKFVTTSRMMRLLLHITTLKGSRSANEEYYTLKKCLKAVSLQYPIINATLFTSSEFCLTSETYTTDNTTLSWPSTRIGVTAIPKNRVCLDEKQNMLSVRRKCGGDFLNGAKWEEVIGDCLATTPRPKTTEKLFDLLNYNITNNLLGDLKKITENHEMPTSFDVFLISSILKKRLTQNQKGDIITFSNIIGDIMSFKKTVLNESQSYLNSTDELLSTTDSFFNAVSPVFIKTDKLIVQVSNYSDKISGLALFKTKYATNGDFQKYYAKPIFRNSTIENILKNTNLDLAVFLPFSLNFSQRLLVIKVFQNDKLFNEVTSNRDSTNSKVVSVNIPGHKFSLNEAVTIVINLENRNRYLKNCSHWKYGIDSNFMSIFGSWVPNHKSTDQMNLAICKYNHITHFALLMQCHSNNSIDNSTQNNALEILNGVGSGLSIVSVIPIFISGLLFKSWVNRTGNIILVNFCLAITLQSAFTFLLYANQSSDIFCSILGALLHYADLCEFSWMLIIAFLQYKRFVIVFNNEDKYILLKTLIVGWVLPLLPVIITFSLSPTNYRRNEYGYCYVIGTYLIYSSLLPIFAILLANFIIFIAIMWNVWKQNTNDLYNSPNYKLQILLAIFLFFSLGLTWFFGVVGVLTGKKWLTYVFCALSSIRGVIIFLFFVVGNKELKDLWIKRFRYYIDSELQETSTYKVSNSISSFKD